MPTERVPKGTSLANEVLHLLYGEWAQDIDGRLHLTELLNIVEAARDLMLRCDGEEGVRGDGSNIDTRGLHAFFDAYDSIVEGWIDLKESSHAD